MENFQQKFKGFDVDIRCFDDFRFDKLVTKKKLKKKDDAPNVLDAIVMH